MNPDLAVTNNSWKYLKIALILVAALTYSCLCLKDLDARHLSFTNDLALSMAVGGEGLKGNIALLGPPSHRGGRHLGPVYYLFVSLVEFLSSNDVETSLKIFTYSSLLLSFLIVLIVYYLFPKDRRYFAALAVLIQFIVSNWPTFVRSAWHAQTLLLTSVAIFALFMHGRTLSTSFWLFILLASLSLQMHFSSLPMLLALGVLSAFVFPISRALKMHWLWICLFATVFLLLWLPPLIFEYHYGSNLSQVAQGSLYKTGSKAGIYEVRRIAYEFFLNFASKVRPPAWLSLALIFSLLLLLARRLQTEIRIWVLGLPLLLTLIFLTQLKAPLMPYFLYALIPVVPLSVAFGLVYAIDEVVSCIALGVLNFWGAIGLIFMACFVSMLGLGLFTSNSSDKFPEFHSLLHAQEVAKILRDDAQGQYFLLFGNQASKYNSDAILYILGEQFYSQMKHTENLKELSVFQKDTSRVSKFAYTLMCPKPFSEQRAKILNIYAADWVYRGEISLSSCTTCGACYLAKLQRKDSIKNN